MNIMDSIKKQAKENVKTIILPESMDERILEAAEMITKEGLAKIILIGNKNEIISKNVNLKVLEIIDPKDSELTDKFVKELCELRKHKGLIEEKARELLLNDYMYFACMLVKNKMADGIVSGACHTTKDVLSPALQIIKTKEGVQLVSSFFLMIVPDCEYGNDGVFIFADPALVQNPSSEVLASIAYECAKNCESLLQIEPKVAFLSHSTYGSANHEHVDKIIEAVKIANEKYKEYIMDGELQLDAAIIPSVAKSKAPTSPLKGTANVLVFPDLDAANITYKAVQRLAKAEAYGPICQGMAYPVNDLSRGCLVEDIVGTVAITSVQSNK